MSRLVIKPKEVYELGQTDILVADTLIMMDSSRIILNKLKTDNFIRTRVAIFGNACVIDGRGVYGKTGRKGKDGETFIGPCKNGTSGRIGARGLDGGNGINLFFYVEKLTIKGKIFITLTGGNGGTGGEGGHGGGGSPGTVHCQGGNGGNGANGGNGGNGGTGGTLTISCTTCTNTKGLIDDKIQVLTQGGYPGSSGRGGYDGPPGLGPSRKNGTPGARGLDGFPGRSGNTGTIKFETN
ncbi:MAG TPA: collagen-like protein [Cyclobacteriaceae bacterium]